jgi:hypothetical protein
MAEGRRRIMLFQEQRRRAARKRKSASGLKVACRVGRPGARHRDRYPRTGTGTLTIGDYSVAGLEDLFSVERKRSRTSSDAAWARTGFEPPESPCLPGLEKILKTMANLHTVTR